LVLVLSPLLYSCFIIAVLSKGQDKVHPRTGHEDPEGGRSIASCILSLTSVLDGGWVVNATTRPLFPQE